MGTTAQKLQYLDGTKQAIKQALTDNGILVPTGTTFREYASKITDIRSKFSFEPLPYTQVSLGGTSVNVSPFLKIYADDGNSYTPQEWYTLPGKGTDIKPLAFDIEACGIHSLIYLKDTAAPAYYEITRTNMSAITAYKHSPYQFSLYTSAQSNLTNPDGTTAAITSANGVLTMTTANCPGKTWVCKADLTNAGGSLRMSDVGSEYDRCEAMYQQVEWLRHRASIETTVATEAPDGTYAEVLIYDDGTDHWFLVKYNGSVYNTGVKAKYNVHSFFNSANPTSAIVDAIYTEQVKATKKLSMNDELSDVQGNVTETTYKILTPGAKGAEAVAYNGKWRIITPVLSNASATFNQDTNMQDAPAIYYNKEILEPLYGAGNVALPNDRTMQAYCLNRTTLLNSLVDFLNSANGGSCNVPSTLDAYVWCATRYSATYAWFVGTGNGSMVVSNTFYRYSVLGASALS
jgi:hypothetical protein